MHLTRIAEAAPHKVALTMADGSRTLTYAELDRRSRQVAALLRGHSCGPGSHVALMMENCPEFLEVAWGAQRAGIYWTPVNWHLTEEEAAYVVQNCGARVLFASQATADVAARLATRIQALRGGYVAGTTRGGLTSYEAARDAVCGESPEEEVEGSYFFYSSGTTGRPEGIKPTHDFPPFGTGLEMDHIMARTFDFGPKSVYLCPAPLYHAAPSGWALGAQRNGGTVVLMEQFEPLACLRAIDHYRVTHAQFVPTHFVRLLKLPDEQREAFEVSSLEVVVHAAAPCPREVKQQIIEWFGPRVMELYGGSEWIGMTVIDSAEWLEHPGSVGKAVLGTPHIVDEEGKEVPPGEVGTVYFEGGGSFEYWGNPAKTAEAFNDRGWATYGDLGSLDEEGYLYLADRRVDLIISGGVNVYPAEVEGALIIHPSVGDVAVIGVPDPEWGQSVKAVVQPAHDVDTGPNLVEELVEHCRRSLASFKCPRSIEFVDQLPRLPSGKLLHRRVREQHGDAI